MTPTKYTDIPGTQDAPKADLAGFLKARIQGGERQPARVQVCLHPTLFADRIEALKAAGGDTTAPEVVALDEQIRAASIRVTLVPQAPEKVFEAQRKVTEKFGSADDTPRVAVWKANLKDAFQSASSLDGDPLDDLDKATWQQLVDVMSFGEVMQLHASLDDATAEPDFPM